MEIAGYPILGWMVLLGGLAIAGWATSFPVIWFLTLRTDGKPRDPDSWLLRHQWLVAVALALFYFVLLGNAVDWQT